MNENQGKNNTKTLVIVCVAVGVILLLLFILVMSIALSSGDSKSSKSRKNSSSTSSVASAPASSGTTGNATEEKEKEPLPSVPADDTDGSEPQDTESGGQSASADMKPQGIFCEKTQVHFEYPAEYEKYSIEGEDEFIINFDSTGINCLKINIYTPQFHAVDQNTAYDYMDMRIGENCSPDPYGNGYFCEFDTGSEKVNGNWEWSYIYLYGAELCKGDTPDKNEYLIVQYRNRYDSAESEKYDAIAEQILSSLETKLWSEDESAFKAVFGNAQNAASVKNPDFQKGWYMVPRIYRGNNGKTVTFGWYDDGTISIMVDNVSSMNIHRDKYTDDGNGCYIYENKEDGTTVNYYPAQNKIVLKNTGNDPEASGEYISKFKGTK